MAISFIKLECPKCGANLSVEEGHKQFFCSYCGAKILLDNDNEFVIRHIDEADVKRVEYERVVKLRELDIEQQAAEERKQARIKKKKRQRVITLGLIVLTVLFFLLININENFIPLFLISFLFSFFGCVLLFIQLFINDDRKR